ncbi:MAG: glycoside hydrolase family 15 protein [Candidatus Binatia bacterium]
MYRPISDYAIIGDTHTAALISSEGSIDWACLPYFDSDAIFLRLLDDAKGGYCAVEPRELVDSKRRYLSMTNILETRFKTSTGVLVLTDFMPVRKVEGVHPTGQDVTSDHRIVRLFRCAEGAVEFTTTIKPTFLFATEQARIVPSEKQGIIFKGSKDVLHIHCSSRFVEKEGQVSATVHLQQGEVYSLVLTHSKPDAKVAYLDIDAAREALNETRGYWEEWSKTCSYQGEYRDLVLRSALTLKLLTFEPTGAILAAPTTSFPEEIGGVRNWDYRFTWLRDATFTLVALMNLGYFGEARDFLRFLRRICDCPSEEFQVLYTIHGHRETKEKILPHLDGYRSSTPVRVGNAASAQKQLDIYGELLDSMYLYITHARSEPTGDAGLPDFWQTVQSVAEHIVRHWRDPDSGIWEVRGGERHFVHSKAMCWVGLNCALKLAERAGLSGDFEVWVRERDTIFESLMQEGFNSEVGAFVQAFGSTALDASILRLPMLGVIEATDPRMRSTIEQIERRLVRNGLVYRYLDADDGLPGGEATFAICTFWLINNYVMLGRLQEAEEFFRHVLSFANDLGLFSEEIDPVTGEQLGNFPQGFTHIALINSAVRIAAAQKGKRAKEQAIVEDVNVR